MIAAPLIILIVTFATGCVSVSVTIAGGCRSPAAPNCTWVTSAGLAASSKYTPVGSELNVKRPLSSVRVEPSAPMMVAPAAPAPPDAPSIRRGPVSVTRARRTGCGESSSVTTTPLIVQGPVEGRAWSLVCGERAISSVRNVATRAIMRSFAPTAIDHWARRRLQTHASSFAVGESNDSRLPREKLEHAWILPIAYGRCADGDDKVLARRRALDR